MNGQTPFEGGKEGETGGGSLENEGPGCWTVDTFVSQATKCPEKIEEKKGLGKAAMGRKRGGTGVLGHRQHRGNSAKLKT